MISLEEVLKFRLNRFDSSYALVAQKGHDYNRSQQETGDTLFNLRVCEILGVVEYAEQGILTRLTDKLMRLISLTSKPGIENAVKDESVLATVDDIHNYVDYLAIIWLKRKEKSLELLCIDCKKLLGEQYYGAGDGTGQKFRCYECYQTTLSQNSEIPGVPF